MAECRPARRRVIPYARHRRTNARHFGGGRFVVSGLTRDTPLTHSHHCRYSTYMTTTAATITSDTAAALEAFGWTTPYNWKNVNNVRVDEYGNSVTIHDQGETVRVEFEYAIRGIVETMNLNPALGGHRIARVIDALSAPAD